MRRMMMLVMLSWAALAAAQSSGPINTPMLNKAYYFVGTSPYTTTIQSAVTAACASAPGGGVYVPPGVSPTDSIAGVTGGCTKVWVMDQRNVPNACYTWNGSSYAMNSCAAGGANPGGGNFAIQYDNNGGLGGANFTGFVFNNGSAGPPTAATAANVNSFLPFVVTTNVTQTITAQKTFTAPIFTNGITDQGTIHANNLSSFNFVTSEGFLNTIANALATATENVPAGDIYQSSNYWNGTSSAVDRWDWNVTLTGTVNPTSTYTLTHLGTPGAASVVIQAPVTEATTTSATSSANVSSPKHCTLGNFWEGFSAPDTWCFQNVLGSGSTPTSTYTLVHNGTSGSTVVAIPYPIQMGGIANTVNLQVATGAGCNLPATTLGRCGIVMTFPISEPDTNYTVIGCQLSNTSFGAILGDVEAGSMTTTGFQINEFSYQNVNASTGGSVACFVMHP